MQKITSIHVMLVEGINAYQKQKRLNPKIHLVVNEYGMPINFIVTNRSRVAIHFYKRRNIIERYFLRLKRFRKVFTRCEKLDFISISTFYPAFILDVLFI